jgi:hypothetical protein
MKTQICEFPIFICNEQHGRAHWSGEVSSGLSQGSCVFARTFRVCSLAPFTPSFACSQPTCISEHAF